MRTAVISDLHLGARNGGDLLRDPGVRRSLLAELDGVDQLVLLGDVIELREAPLAAVLESARPLFAELGDAMAGRRIVVVPGNHDHQIDPWVDRRRFDAAAKPLGLEQVRDPEPGGPLATLAGYAAGAEVVLAYPGLWIRPDVYATHGHYLDAHHSVPILECVAVSITERLLGGLPDDRRRPDDYEAVVAPLYAFAYSLAQGTRHGKMNARASVALWRRLVGRSRVRAALAGLALSGSVFALNRGGLGPFRASFSGERLDAAPLLAMAEVVRRLGIQASHVVFGHTHRAGPLGDEPGWRLPEGSPCLVNAGSWLYTSGLRGAPSPDSPYWPGVVVIVDEAGPPELRRVPVEPA